jgi:uncharacterized repeat protein (TIGR01451 family)
MTSLGTFIRSAIRGRRAPWARAVVGCALVMGLAPVASAAAQTGSAVRVVNRATVTFTTDDGGTGSAEGSSTVFVQITPGVRISAPQTAALRPGDRRVFAHRLENLGNGPDRFVLGTSGPAGWSVQLFRDLDGDGALGAADTAVSSPLPLDRGASAALLLVVDVPPDVADVAGVAVEVRATSTLDPSVTDVVRDTISVRRPLAAVTLAKSVDRAEATVGDTLVYTLSFANGGDAPATPAELADPLPAGLHPVAGSIRLNGAALTDAADADAGSVERGTDGRQTVRVRLGELAGGASGVVVFRAVVAADAGESLSNGATLAFGSPTAEVASPVVRTTLVRPGLTVSKERIGSDTVQLGGEVSFRLGWGNSSATVAVREAVLTDTLPAGLAFVRAEGNPEVRENVIRWTLGTLAPGQTGSLLIVTRAVAASDAPVVNRVVARGSNATAVDAAAAAVTVTGLLGNELEVTKRAAVLEAGLGEAVAYSVAVTNRALVPLRDVRVADFLPAGVRFLAGRLTGADSARVDGSTVHIFLGSLAAAETRTVRYAVTIVSPGSATALGNRATATAEGGRIHSDTATAWVRLRRGSALQARTVMGKVWLDRNDNGRQEAGEEGVAGVDVWSEDGEVVTTDRYGRYSFRNVRIGTHALRVDTVGLPGDATFARRGEGIVQIRMDGWTTPRADFRLVPRAAPGIGGVTAPNAPADRTDGGPAAGPAAADTASAAAPARSGIAPARTAQARADEDGRTFTEGPTVRIFAPVDGEVLATNKVYVGIRGEAGTSVSLFDGDSLLGEARVRGDGQVDFVGLSLGEGPHRLRAVMKNSWGRVRTDSVAVHSSGAPATFEMPSSFTLYADAPRADTVRIRVLDQWGVAIAGRAAVTVEGTRAEPLGSDADASSVGQQLRADAEGWLQVPLRPGHDVGPGELRLASGDARGLLPLRVLPSTRPLIVTGAGQVGIGAAPGAFGAVTVRGAVGRETSVSVSYDSRRSRQQGDYFDGAYDPLDESRYPTFGDGSESRVFSSATQNLSMRVERGFDWMELGDVQTGDFAGDPRLGVYSRSLTGVSGRVRTGHVTWRGFGSFTDQVLAQQQLRGNGTSGPYRFGGTIRPGTDRVAIEVRARDNAARVIARQELARWTDYQIDYLTGEILLQHAVPGTDAAGNPVYLVAMLERRAGGERRPVGGARMELDAARALMLGGVDSLTVSLMGVRDGGEVSTGAGGQDLLGTGVRFRQRGVTVGGELLRSQRPDSAALAGRAEMSWSLLKDRARVDAEWLRVGEGFASSTDPRLSAGVRELRVGGEMKLGEGNTVRVSHERQRFDGYGVERANTFLRTRQTSLDGRVLTTEGGLSSDADGQGTTSSAVGKLSLALTPKSDVWVEGTRSLSQAQPRGLGAVNGRPDHVGVGGSYRILPGTRVEAAHRWVSAPGDSARDYGLSSFNLRTEAILGGQLWGGLERADAERAAHSAVLGWNQRLSLHGGWAVTTMYERRFGLERAPLVDPLRALPFIQQERDRWSASAGLEFFPSDSTLRLNSRAEMHGGAEARGYRIDVSGDIPIGASAALLTRHDWWQDERSIGLGEARQLARRDRSVIGLAMRPAEHDNLNLLAKMEWRRTINPLGGGVLAGNAEDRRLIGAGDAIWGARRGTELGARYAVRWSARADSAAGVIGAGTLSHFLGGRVQQELRGPVALRVDGRMLMDATGQASRWNLAPALVVGLGSRVELEGGYRFGDLKDLDFAEQGGSGVYVTLGVRFTESVLGSAAQFWRERIGRDQ